MVRQLFEHFVGTVGRYEVRGQYRYWWKCRHGAFQLKQTVDFIDELPGNKFHIIMFCGTHQGAATDKHFDYYLDEYAFRFNRRASHYRGKLFYRLIQNAVIVEPTTYDKIVNIEK